MMMHAISTINGQQDNDVHAIGEHGGRGQAQDGFHLLRTKARSDSRISVVNTKLRGNFVRQTAPILGKRTHYGS
jgi:hypothetical protein